jgi:hypothetical protein
MLKTVLCDDWLLLWHENKTSAIAQQKQISLFIRAKILIIEGLN